MRKIFLTLFVALISSSPANADCQVGKLLEFKITMQGSRPLADIGIDGRILPFIVDSGAFFSTISPGTAAELGLRPVTSRIQVRGIGGMAGRTYVALVNTVDLAGVPLHNVQFIVAGSEFGAGGLLGQNILGIGDVEYDFGHGAVRIMRSKGCSVNDNLAYWAGQEPVSDLPIDFRNAAQPHTIGTIFVNGAKVRAVFDTGAGSSILSLAAAKRVGAATTRPRLPT
jgi:predicted aspartyl protease